MMAIALRFLLGRTGRYMLLAIAISVGLAWSHMKAYNGGWNRNEARHAAATVKLNEELTAIRDRLRIAVMEFQAAERTNDELEQRLATDAAAEPTRDDHGLAPGFMRGIDAIR